MTWETLASRSRRIASGGRGGRIPPTVLVLLLLSTPVLARPCLTREEAKAKWPEAHLYWHTEERCWDNHPRSDGDFEPRAKTRVIIPTSPPPDVARAAPGAPEATLYFPELHSGLFGFAPVSPLFWPRPWFSTESAVYWPKLIDVDRVPFTTWVKRIGE